MSKPTAEEYIKNNPLYEFLDGTVTPRPDLKFDRKGNIYKVKCKKCGEKSEFKDDNVYNVKCKHCDEKLNLDDIPRKEKSKKSKKKSSTKTIKKEVTKEDPSDDVVVEDPSSDEESNAGSMQEEDSDSLGAQLEATFKGSKLVSETPSTVSATNANGVPKKTEKPPKKTEKPKTEKQSPEGLIKQLDSDLSIKELLKLIKPNSSGNIEIMELKQGQILKYKDKLYIVE